MFKLFCRAGSAGFTLIELLVAVSVIGLLIATLLPALAMGRESSRRPVCLGNLHQFVTPTLPPNAVVAYMSGGVAYHGLGFTSRRKHTAAAGYTYAAVTARSYHGSGANPAFMDGSVHHVPDAVNPETWV